MFYILNYGSSAVRNIVRGGVLEALVAKGFRCVVFGLPESERASVKDAFGDNVVFETLETPPLRGLTKLIQRLRTYVWRNQIPYGKLLAHFGKKLTMRHSFQAAVGRMLAGVPFRVWEKLAENAATWPQGEELLRKYRPSAVVVSNPMAADGVPIDYCRKHGIYTACMLESWDNLTVRGAFYSSPHDLLVWNDLIRRQAICFHQYPPERVRTVGIPSFDIYTHPELLPSEAEWRKSVGLLGSGPVIVYSTSAQIIYGREDVIIDNILHAREIGMLPANANLLIRPHPADDFAAYDKYQGQAGVAIQYPYAAVGSDGNDVTMGKPLMLAATMRYAAVVINVFSTMCLDAMANGAPVIVIGFDAVPVPPERSVRNYTELQHIKELLEFNAVSLANSGEELLGLINQYLNDRSFNLENRQQCVAAETFGLDGRAAARVADLIANRSSQYAQERKAG
ncbi:MAG: hypothetical protein K8H75_01480 [Sulfuricella sp.]|nr:hypothetical protein [Sulfuricella sp.]